MSFLFKKKSLKKIVSSFTMLTTVIAFSGVMALSSVAVAAEAIVDGDLIKSNAINSDGTPTIESLDVYIVKVVAEKKFKRLILSPTVFESYGHLNYGDIQTVSQAVMDEYTTSSLVRVDTDPDEKVYAMVPSGDTGAKGWVNLTTIQFIDEASSDADSIYTINAVDGGSYTTVGDVTTVVELTTFYSSGELPDVTPVAAGTLAVALSSSTPGSTTVPSNATGVVFTKLNFAASTDGDASVTGITIKRSGVGATTDISKVYLYDGAIRLTTGKTVSSSTNEAIFTNLNVTIAAGTTKTLSIVADIANSVSGQHAFGITSVDAVTGSATVSGSFPVSGNNMALSTTTVGKADVEASTTTYTRKVGETDVIVGNFTVYVNATEDAQFKAITLYNSGRDILSNVKLYRGSDMVGTAVQSGSNYIVTLDTPYLIEKSQSAIFTVKADVGGRNADTATLYVRYNTDVVVTGNTFGYNLGIDQTEGGSAVTSYVEEVATTLLSNVTTMEAGQLTITTSGPGATDVSKNTTNVVLLDFAIASQATVDVSKMVVTLSGTNLIPADIDNLDLIIDGVVVGTKSTVVVGTNTFTDIFTLIGGETTQGQIIIDINNTAAGNETIAATLTDMTSTTNFLAKTTDGDTVTDIIPSGDITGKTMTVTSASLTLDLASSPASGQTFVKGTADASLAGFAFKAGSAADVKVTSVTLRAFLDDNTTGFTGADLTQASGAKGVLTSIGIYDGTTLVAPKKTLTIGTATITVTFDGLSLIIPKGSTKTLVVKSDLSNTLVSSNDDKVAITIFAAGDVVAEYGTGSNLAPTLSTNNNTPTISQTVAGAGTLTMALDSATPGANLVVAGTQDVVYTTFKLTSTKEAFRVTKLNVNNSANDNSFTGIALSYKDEAGATREAIGSLVSNIASFSFASGDEIYVKKDSSVVVTIKANLNTISGGAVNEAASVFTADFDTNFEAKGVASGDTITTATGTAAVAATATVDTDIVITADTAGTAGNSLSIVIASSSADLTKGSITITKAGDVITATVLHAITSATVNVTRASVITALNMATDTGDIQAGTVEVVITNDVTGFITASGVSTVKVAAVSSTSLTGGLAGIGVNGVGASMTLYDAMPVVNFASSTPSGTLTPSASTLVALIDVTATGNKDITFVNSLSNILTVSFAASATDGGSAANAVLKRSDGTILDTKAITIATGATAATAAFSFATNALTVAAGTTETLSVYLDTTQLEDQGDSVYGWLDDSTATFIDWSIDSVGSFNQADIIFKGDPVGGTLLKG